MGDIGKTLVLFGIILVLLGLLLSIGPKIPFLGKLPGDIYFKKDGFTFYSPIATSILLSILLTLLFNFFKK